MITLRAYQQDSIDAIYVYYASNSGNCLLVLPTGGGKSVIIAAFIMRALQDYPDTRV